MHMLEACLRYSSQQAFNSNIDSYLPERYKFTPLIGGYAFQSLVDAVGAERAKDVMILYLLSFHGAVTGHVDLTPVYAPNLDHITRSGLVDILGDGVV